MMLQAQRRWLVYKCTTGPACAQLFFTGRSLKRHQTLHHHHTPEWRNTFCCSLCDEEFEVLSSLQAHAVRQHYEAGELGSDLEPGLEPCDTGSQRQAGACVQTRRTSKSVVSPSNLAECSLKSARSKTAKTAKSTVKFAVHSLAESEWRSAKSMQQSTTKCGVSIAKSAHCVTRCAPSTTNTALSSTQSPQHSESSTELGAVLSVTQNIVTPLVPTEHRPNTPQLKAAWKPLTDGSASGNLTVKSPTMTTVKTGEMIQTNGDCSARSAAQVQQQHSRGITVDARVQSLGNVTRRTAKGVTHRPTEAEKLKAKAPVSQKKKYKTGRIRAFKGERVVSSSIAVSSVKQLESCDGRGLLICQVCGQVFVSAARIREHLTEHPKCSRCLEHFSHEIDVAEHLCILKENSPKAGDITDDSMMHIDEEVTAVEPHNQDKSVSSNYASPIQSLDAFSSSGGISLSHHSISSSETSCVPRALAVHAEASSILPAVGQGEDLSTSAATSDGSAPSCEAKTCPACSATFPSSVALVRHTLSHRPMQFFQCTACENIFTSRGSFTEHLSQCPSQEGCYSCSACSKPFSTLKGLRAHERRYHFQTPGAADGNAFTCPECEQVFRTQTAYVNHLITHAVQQNHSDPKSLQCQVCSSSFYTRQALQKHMNSHKTDSISIPVSCPLCSETFANRRALVAHQKKHLYCPFCSRNFVSRAELDEHNRETHPNERPWTCSLCHASYKFRFDLIRHQLKHEGKKFYACSTCGRDFYASTDLRQHEASVHSVTPRTKPFMCGQCGKRFFTRGHLNTHRRSHSSLQPFQCPHCPVRCKTTKNLEIHIRRHTGELPIKCKVCGEGFVDHCYLGRHMARHKPAPDLLCGLCSKAFYHHQHLKQHVLGRHFVCFDCESQFRDKKELKQHQRECPSSGAGLYLKRATVAPDTSIVVEPVNFGGNLMGNGPVDGCSNFADSLTSGVAVPDAGGVCVVESEGEAEAASFGRFDEATNTIILYEDQLKKMQNAVREKSPRVLEVTIPHTNSQGVTRLIIEDNTLTQDTTLTREYTPWPTHNSRLTKGNTYIQENAPKKNSVTRDSTPTQDDSHAQENTPTENSPTKASIPTQDNTPLHENAFTTNSPTKDSTPTPDNTPVQENTLAKNSVTKVSTPALVNSCEQEKAPVKSSLIEGSVPALLHGTRVQDTSTLTSDSRLLQEATSAQGATSTTDTSVREDSLTQHSLTQNSTSHTQDSTPTQDSVSARDNIPTKCYLTPDAIVVHENAFIQIGTLTQDSSCMQDNTSTKENTLGLVQETTLTKENTLGFVQETALVQEKSLGFVQETTLVQEKSLGFVQETALVQEKSLGFVQETTLVQEKSLGFVQETMLTRENSTQEKTPTLDKALARYNTPAKQNIVTRNRMATHKNIRSQDTTLTRGSVPAESTATAPKRRKRDGSQKGTEDIPGAVNMARPEEAGEGTRDETLTGDVTVDRASEDSAAVQNEFSTSVGKTTDRAPSAPECAQKGEAAAAIPKLKQPRSKGRRQKVPPKKSKKDTLLLVSKSQITPRPGEAANLPAEVELGGMAPEESDVSEKNETATPGKMAGFASSSTADSSDNTAPSPTGVTVPTVDQFALIANNVSASDGTAYSPDAAAPSRSVSPRAGAGKAPQRSPLKDLRVVLVDVMHTLQCKLPDSASEDILQTVLIDSTKTSASCNVKSRDGDGEISSVGKGSTEQKQDGAEVLAENVSLDNFPYESNQRWKDDSVVGKATERPEQAPSGWMKSVAGLAVGKTYFKCRQCALMFSSRFAALAHVCPSPTLSRRSRQSPVILNTQTTMSSLPALTPSPLDANSTASSPVLHVENGGLGECASALPLAELSSKKGTCTTEAGSSASRPTEHLNSGVLATTPVAISSAKTPQRLNTVRYRKVTTALHPSLATSGVSVQKYQCLYCDALFLTLEHITEHTKIHFPKPVATENAITATGVVCSSSRSSGSDVTVPVSDSKTSVAGSSGTGPVVSPVSDTMSSVSSGRGPLVLPQSDSKTPVSSGTGRVVSPVSGRVVSPVSGRVVSPVTGRVVSPVSGRMVSPVSGRVVSPVSGRVVSPVSGRVVSPVSGRMVSPVSGRVVSPVSGRVVSPVSDAVVPAGHSRRQQMSSVLISIPTLSCKSKVLSVAVPVSRPRKCKTVVVGVAGSDITVTGSAITDKAKGNSAELKTSPVLESFAGVRTSTVSVLASGMRKAVEDADHGSLTAPTSVAESMVVSSVTSQKGEVPAADATDSLPVRIATPPPHRTDRSSGSALLNASGADLATVSASQTGVKDAGKTFTLPPDATTKAGCSTTVSDTQCPPSLPPAVGQPRNGLPSQHSSPPPGHSAATPPGHSAAPGHSAVAGKPRCRGLRSRLRVSGGRVTGTGEGEARAFPVIRVVDGKAVATRPTPGQSSSRSTATAAGSSALAGLAFHCSVCRRKFSTVAQFTAHASLRHQPSTALVSAVRRPGRRRSTFRQRREPCDPRQKAALARAEWELAKLKQEAVCGASERSVWMEEEREKETVCVASEHRELSDHSQNSVCVDDERGTVGRQQDAARVTKRLVELVPASHCKRPTDPPQPSADTSPAALPPQPVTTCQCPLAATPVFDQNTANQPSVSTQPNQNSANQTTVSPPLQQSSTNQTTVSPPLQQSSANQTTVSLPLQQSSANQMTVSSPPEQGSANPTTVSHLPHHSSASRTASPRKSWASEVTDLPQSERTSPKPRSGAKRKRQLMKGASCGGTAIIAGADNSQAKRARTRMMEFSAAKPVEAVWQPDGPYQCDVCSDSFSSIAEVQQHLQSAHSLWELYQCSHCVGVFSSLTNLTAHFHRHAQLTADTTSAATSPSGSSALQSPDRSKRDGRSPAACSSSSTPLTSRRVEMVHTSPLRRTRSSLASAQNACAGAERSGNASGLTLESLAEVAVAIAERRDAARMMSQHTPDVHLLVPKSLPGFHLSGQKSLPGSSPLGQKSLPGSSPLGQKSLPGSSPVGQKSLPHSFPLGQNPSGFVHALVHRSALDVLASGLKSPPESPSLSLKPADDKTLAVPESFRAPAAGPKAAWEACYTVAGKTYTISVSVPLAQGPEPERPKDPNDDVTDTCGRQAPSQASSGVGSSVKPTVTKQKQPLRRGRSGDEGSRCCSGPVEEPAADDVVPASSPSSLPGCSAVRQQSGRWPQHKALHPSPRAGQRGSASTTPQTQTANPESLGPTPSDSDHVETVSEGEDDDDDSLPVLPHSLASAPEKPARRSSSSGCSDVCAPSPKRPRLASKGRQAGGVQASSTGRSLAGEGRSGRKARGTRAVSHSRSAPRVSAVGTSR